jgi:hypothetical protein
VLNSGFLFLCVYGAGRGGMRERDKRIY